MMKPIQPGVFQPPARVNEVEDVEAFNDFWNDLCDGSMYWLWRVELTGNRSLLTHGDTIRFTEDCEGEEGEWTITADDVVATIRDYSAWLMDPERREFLRRFARAAFTGDYGNADYDAGVTDVVLQLAVFGYIKYA